MVPSAKSSSSAAHTSRRWRASFVAVLAGMALLRAWFAASLPLAGDEAYFWEWSRHLALGYYDHPGLVAWVLAASTVFFPAGSELGVRLPSILAMLACAEVCRRFTQRMAAELGLVEETAERAAVLAGLLVLAVPVFAFFGVYLAGDPLLYLCWALAMDLGWRAASGGGLRVWLCFGLAVGAGLEAKLLFLPFLPAFGLFLLASRARRRWFARHELWSAAAVALLLCVPTLWWNATHDWATFRFNLAARHDTLDGVAAFLELLASQALVLTPVVFAWAVAASGGVLWSWRSAPAPDLHLVLLFAVPLAGYVLQSLTGVQVGAHWPAPAALSALVLLPVRIEQWSAGGGAPRARRMLLATLGLGALLSVLGHAALLLPPGALERLALTHPTREAQFNTGRLNELHGWRELGERVAAVRAEMLVSGAADRGVFLLAAQYGVAAQVAFYTPGQPAVRLWEPPRRHGQSYREWDRFEPLRGQDALFVTKHERILARSLSELREHFTRVHEPERFPILRDGHELRAFHLVRCEGFDGVAPSFP